jgi:hypothetical protein
VQAAQLSDLLAFVHDQMSIVIDAATQDPVETHWKMRLDWVTWQRMLELEMQLAIYQRRIADPNA